MVLPSIYSFKILFIFYVRIYHFGNSDTNFFQSVIIIYLCLKLIPKLIITAWFVVYLL